MELHTIGIDLGKTVFQRNCLGAARRPRLRFGRHLLAVEPCSRHCRIPLPLAIYLFAEAVLEFILSFQLRPVRGWGWLLFDGVITPVIAILIWRTWPAGSLWALGTLVGISMLFSGVARLMVSLAARTLIASAS
jgi:uncharacterized membrane protein HdeD (DUF308 family)